MEPSGPTPRTPAAGPSADAADLAPRPPGLVERWVPGIASARTYRRGWLRGDVVAGLALTALLVPQGMAYAELAGLPPVTGLYTTVIVLVAYALFGPSRILVLGPDSALGPMIFAAIVPLAGANGDPARAIALAGMLAILMGACCVAVGAVRGGNLAELLSKPVRVGYINGIALVVLVSQLPKLFGFSVDADGLIPELKAFIRGVADGKTNGTALAVGIASIVVILAMKTWLPKIPGVLVAVVGATVVSAVFDLAAKGVPVVGGLPQGFPVPKFPSVGWHDLATLLPAAAGMAFITLADTSTLSRTFAARHGTVVDPNREIIALGLSNAAAGLFQGFPVSASASRTAVAEQSGARTQLAGVTGAVGVLALLLFANSLIADLPSSTLAAVVIVAGLALFDVKTVLTLWRIRRTEAVLCLAALVGVAVLGVLPGIAIAIGLSVGAFVTKQWRPYAVELGLVDGREGYHDIERHPDAEQVPGLLIFRFDAPIFFANAERFGRYVLDAVASRPDTILVVVVAAEPITDVDTTGAEALDGLVDRLDALGITLALAEMKGPVKDRLRRYGIYDRIAGGFFNTVEDAVDSLQARAAGG
jgi:high affinity sulfate transporter 1